jgi:signal transduction histidine kinase
MGPAMPEFDRSHHAPVVEEPSLRLLTSRAVSDEVGEPRAARATMVEPKTSQAEQARDHMRVMASEATALLAHDLNNGLSVVKANLDYLGESLAAHIAGDPETSDATRSAQRALDRMITLVKNFVDIARMEDAVLVTNRTIVDIHELVNAVAQIHMPRRSAAQIELTIDVAPGLAARVDAILLERILHNLVGNAARYVNRGGVVRIAAKVVEQGDGAALVLAVGNSGPAILDPLRSTLFEKYGCGRDRRSQTGMGLYFCRLAAEAHGGTIGLRSTTGLGVDIEVRLPFAPGAR